MADMNMTDQNESPIEANPELGGNVDSTDASKPDDAQDAGQQLTPDDVIKHFKDEIQKAKKVRRKKIPIWKRNIEDRIGRTARVYTEGLLTSDEVTAEISPDWSLSKTKVANLFSQMPEVRLTHMNEQYKPAVGPFAKALNFEAGEKRTNIAPKLEEELYDVVNASGIGAIYVGYTAKFGDPQELPVQPTTGMSPEQVQAGIQSGQIQTKSVTPTISSRFFAQRVSPADLLTPAGFTGSVFDEADWVGYSGELPLADATAEFKLNDAQLEKIKESEMKKSSDDLHSDEENRVPTTFKPVRFDEIFYWRHRVDPTEKSFKAIYRLVFVEGIDQPVVDEPWRGQKYVQDGQYVGACKFPVQVLTLTYVTDNPNPPSDTQMGRPQVRDLQRSREQFMLNRERSLPMRWHNINLTDPEVMEQYNDGTWQGTLPVNGDGGRAFGEVARASYPSEDMAFDRQTQSDLNEVWRIGPNQQGNIPPGDRTKSEVQTAQNNFSTGIGPERARVARHFLNIMEVLAGLMALHSDFDVLSPQERQVMQQAWDNRSILHDLVFNILPDSQIVLDANQQVQRMGGFLNLTAKSGYVNVKPIIEKMAELSGIDPNEIMIDPQPPPTPEPSISYRFSGKEDLYNPVVMAMLVHTKQAPTPQDMTTAVNILKSAQDPSLIPQPPQGAPGQPPAGGPGGQPPAPPPGAQAANPQMALANKVAKRSDEIKP